MVDFENKLYYDVYDLKKIMALLRGPGGCPWDFEQTHESIRRNLLEEAYEAAEAIDDKDSGHLCEELGDVLMQVVFHSDIEEKAGRFTLDDVANGACTKLIRRHPHVFGSTSVKDSGEVLNNWDSIKREEKQHTKTSESMNSVAHSLPALWRAEKIQAKAAKAGFDWASHEDAMEALRDELRELEEAVASAAGLKELATSTAVVKEVSAADIDETDTAEAEEAAAAGIKEELGDLLFAAVSAARFLGVDPEEALNLSSEKFISRFTRVENAADEKGLTLKDMPVEEIEALYSQVKSN